ncbi:MAG: hypothetical protein ACK5L7_05045, partial [Paludibacteraceae bacterium]
MFLRKRKNYLKAKIQHILLKSKKIGGKLSDTQELDANIASQNPNVTPTDKQKETSNYAKVRVNLQGCNITIENPKGSSRSGKDEKGNAWSNEMKNHYGELDGTVGYDGDPIDVFIGDNPNSGQVFVIDQVNPETGAFDESKAMLGFDTAEQAKQAYLGNYDKDWQGFGAITPAGDNFKAWLYDGAKQRKPFAAYKDTPEAVESVKPKIDINPKLSAQPYAGQDLRQINERFNSELQQQIDGTLAQEHVYRLGMPGWKLLNAGIDDSPIEITAQRLKDKSAQADHPFDLSELKDLATAIQNPIAVFDSATQKGSYVVLTEIEHNGKNFVVAIDANKKKGSIEINDIRSIHYRSNNIHIANWINS